MAAALTSVRGCRATGAGARPPARQAVMMAAVRPGSSAVAGVAAALLLASPPAFAVLPEGIASPLGSDSAVLEAQLDAAIEKRTGKEEALPELTEPPQVEVPKAAPIVVEAPPTPVVAAPLAPAVAEPPAPARPAASPAAAPSGGLQQRAPLNAAPAAGGPSPGVLIAGASVLVLGAAAAVALGGQGEDTPAPSAPVPAGEAAAPAPEGGAPQAADGAAGEAGEQQ